MEGASNEYPQHMFLLRNKKIIRSFWTVVLDFRIDYCGLSPPLYIALTIVSTKSETDFRSVLISKYTYSLTSPFYLTYKYVYPVPIPTVHLCHATINSSRRISSSSRCSSTSSSIDRSSRSCSSSSTTTTSSIVVEVVVVVVVVAM